MSMTDERLAELDAVMAKATAAFPITSRDTADYAEITFGSSQTQAMSMEPATLLAINDVFAAIPDLRAHIEAQAATIARLEAELEKTTHPHFWWDVDDGEDGCDDITSILDNYDVGEVVELSCARSLPNQWAVGYVTESGGFRGQTFATEADAVAFAAERTAPNRSNRILR